MATPGTVPYRVAVLDFWDGKRRDDLSHDLAEACLSFSPQVAVREGEAVFLEVGRCHHLYSEKTLEQRLKTLARRFGCEARVAIENSSAQALAVARFGAGELPLESMEVYFSPFRAVENDVRRYLAEMFVSLQRLGVRSLNELFTLPSAGFASRFGKTGVELLARIRAAKLADLEAWPGFKLREGVEEQADTECENLEALIFVLRGIVDRAMARLRGRGERAASVEVEVQFEAWSTNREKNKAWRLALPVAQGSASGLIPILNDRIGGALRSGLSAPIKRVIFKVLETVPGLSGQRDFFIKKEEQKEALDALVARLSDRLGFNASGEPRVFYSASVDRHLPEKAFARQLEPQTSRHSGQGSEDRARPSRVLSTPQPVEFKAGVLFLPDRKSVRVREWRGPERLSGEWWKQVGHNAGFDRDYYRVVTEMGVSLWVFSDRSSNARHALYLHGYFD